MTMHFIGVAPQSVHPWTVLVSIHILMCFVYISKGYAGDSTTAEPDSSRWVSSTAASRTSDNLFLSQSADSVKPSGNAHLPISGEDLRRKQEHATSLVTIADQLNVSIVPYDEPLVVLFSNATLPRKIVTLKSVINNSIISSDDKTAGDLYEFQWTISDMSDEAKKQTHLNLSNNLAWASLSSLVPGNYTVKLVVSRRPSDSSVLAVNGSFPSSPVAVQHAAALGEAVKKIIVARKSDVSSTEPRANSTLAMFPNRIPEVGVPLTKTALNHPPLAEISPAGTRRITKSGSPVVFVDVSKDNDAGDSIVERKWSVIAKPAAYPGFPKNDSENAAQLTLNNLPPGNYTFQLTVKDLHGATNSTSVQVITAYEDRPPVALVGGDSILRMSTNSPETNQVTLDGSKSSDDNGITSYEWTRVNHLDEMLDIKGANKPILTVSGFQHLGDYIFVLTVKDASNQTDTHQVHVAVVKSEEDEPRAVVGDDLTVMAPVQSVVLNGTLSKPQGMLLFLWTQAAGPSRVTIENADRSVANARNFLVPGEYQFQLSVKHLNSGKKSETKLKVMVNQGTNKPPVADAGPDRQVSLPFPVFSVNGSTSGDDLGIERYTWLVNDNNPAGATIVDNSQHESVLVLRGLVAGMHKFHLTVSDAQQLSSNASVTIEVLPDKFELERVELVIKPSLYALRQLNINDIEHALFLILSHTDNIDAATLSQSTTNNSSYYNIFIDAVEIDRVGGNTRIIFHVIEHSIAAVEASTSIVGITEVKKETVSLPLIAEVKVADGLLIADQLRQHFKRQRSTKLVGFEVLLVDTFVCRNPCSGHGECNNATKHCRCHMFWWPSPIRALVGDGQSNCDWSTFYVVLCALVLVLFSLAVVHGFVNKQHLSEVKDFMCRTVSKFVARSKISSGDISGSDGTINTGGSQRPRRRRYRLLDSSPSPVNDADDNSVAVPKKTGRKSVKHNDGTAAVHLKHIDDAAETSLEMTRRQYYSGHRQQQQPTQKRYKSAFNAAYDEENEDDEESESETLYDASTRRLVRPSPESTLVSVKAVPRQRISSTGTSTSGDIGTFGSGTSRNQSSSSTPVAQPMMNGATRIAISPVQHLVQLNGRTQQQNRNQSSSNLSGSYDSGMVLT